MSRENYRISLERRGGLNSLGRTRPEHLEFSQDSLSRAFTVYAPRTDDLLYGRISPIPRLVDFTTASQAAVFANLLTAAAML